VLGTGYIILLAFVSDPVYKELRYTLQANSNTRFELQHFKVSYKTLHIINNITSSTHTAIEIQLEEKYLTE